MVSFVSRAKCTAPKPDGGNPIHKRTAAVFAHLLIFLTLSVQADASIFHNPFHRKAQPAPHIPLTMESEIKLAHGVEPSRVQKYIIAYQSIRDSLHKFRDDERRGELEVSEIAAVQADLDMMEQIDDPEHNVLLPPLAEILGNDVETLVDLDDSLDVLAYVSYHKPRPGSEWDADLHYVKSELQHQHATSSTDPWYTEATQAYHRALDDREDYLAGASTTFERVENDIIEARFDLHCIGTHLCDLRRQDEGN